jgi:membrane-bound lytic murein transglycosylase D
MMRRIGLKLVLAFSLIFVVFIFIFAKAKNPENTTVFNERYAVYSLHMPDKLEFAGERIPLEYFDIKEGLDRELHINTYWQSQTIFLIKRANRYFPEIEAILKEEGIPDDFKYLAVAESGLTNTVSPANAVGFWQILKNTANDYGLGMNKEIDERFNLEKSTHAACQFLKDSYKIYGNWALSAASYNMGRQGLSKLIETQKENNYFNLALNEETSRYLFRILAIKLIIERPDLYGFHISKSDLYPPLKYNVITIDSSISNLADFAKSKNTNYKLLRLFNPWLRENSLTNMNRCKYSMRIPVDGFRESLYTEISEVSDSIPHELH